MKNSSSQLNIIRNKNKFMTEMSYCCLHTRDKVCFINNAAEIVERYADLIFPDDDIKETKREDESKFKPEWESTSTFDYVMVDGKDAYKEREVEGKMYVKYRYNPDVYYLAGMLLEGYAEWLKNKYKDEIRHIRE